MDADVSAARRRGLKAVPLPSAVSHASLVAALGPGSPQSFDAVVVFGAPDERQLEAATAGSRWEQPEVLQALAGLRSPSGK